MTITELYAKELAFWTVANQSFLGLTPIDENDNFADIQASIDRDCEKYWNTDSPCKLARYFNNGVLNYDASKQTKNSYQLKLNFHSMCVDISGDYNGKRLKLGAMPLPCIDLCWIINILIINLDRTVSCLIFRRSDSNTVEINCLAIRPDPDSICLRIVRMNI